MLDMAKVEDARRRLNISIKKHTYYATDHVTPVGFENVVECREDGVRNRDHLAELRHTLAEADIQERLNQRGFPSLFELGKALYEKSIELRKLENQPTWKGTFHPESWEKLGGIHQEYWMAIAQTVLDKLGI